MEILPGTPRQSPAAGIELLQRLNPADVDATQRVLSEFVIGLHAAAPSPTQHLEMLEAARAKIDAAQTELAKRYASHPLPPDSVENETLQRVVALWRAVARSYAGIAGAEDGALHEHRALLAQRRVDAAGKALLEYFRAHRAVPARAWSELHASYAAAEGEALAHVRVPDPLNEVWKAQSTTEAYVAVLLVELANPFGRSQREFDWVCRWAQRFSPYCRIDTAAGGEAAKPAAYGLDLAADYGLRPLGVLPASASLRRFEGSRLAGQIRGVIGQFKQGAAPASLGLGADCPPDASTRLLLSLYRPWGLASAGRRFPRRGCNGKAELCGDWLAIGFNVAGRPFEQPSLFPTPRGLSVAVPLPAFGEPGVPPATRGGDPRQHREAERHGFAAERWTMFDQSVNGFRLLRQPQHERLDHRQLVGIRPPDGERFLLGQVSWLMYRDDAVMEAGIQVLPGLPKVVAARQSDLLRGRHIAYQPAFLLAAVPALKSGPSLVLPAGWFRPHGVIDIHDDKPMQFRLTGLVLQGKNFDQVTFECVAAPAERDARQGSRR